MTHRRTLLITMAVAAARAAHAQATDADLPAKGAPKGRVGGATRGFHPGDGSLAIDLVAPAEGVGVTAVPSPKLYYLVSGPVTQPMRFTVSLHGQARPVVDAAIPAASHRGMYALSTREFNLRLVPELLYVWSVAVVRDPQAPSNDLVVSALLQYRPAPPAVESALRAAAPEQQAAVLAKAGFWYDAVAAADGMQARGGPATLDAMLRQEGLDTIVSTARP